MMRLHNIARCLIATLALCSTVWCAQRAGAHAMPQPDAAGVARAYTTLRSWVDALELPKPTDEAARVPIDGASGVCVIVRRSGRMLGWGADTSGDALMLRRATAAALGDVLADSTVSSLPKNLRDSIGPSLTVELEVAGEMTPLIGTTLRQVASRIQPGLDGLAMRRGRELLALFPSHMRATNTAADPESRLMALAVRLGLSAKDTSNLAARTDVAVYGFRTIHLIQPAPDRPPIQTYRGDVVVAMPDLDRTAVAELADGLAAHLLTRIWPESATAAERKPLGMMGSYNPCADVYEPLVAPPLEQALCAMALQRYASLDGIDRTRSAAASNAARLILADLAHVVDGESDPLLDPASCAAIVLATLENPSLIKDAAIGPMFERAAQFILASIDEKGGIQSLSPNQQALIGNAACRLLAFDEKSAKGVTKPESATVRAALDHAWSSVPPHQHVALLPWIGWAEVEYTRATGKALAHQKELQVMREALDRSRIDENSNAALDLIGGLNFTVRGADTSEQPRADAQTVRAAAWLAGLIRDERFTPPGQTAAALDRHMQTMRFVIQLSTRRSPPAVLATFREPNRAVGGLRAAPWDWQQPLPAQALGLITAVQTPMAMDQSPTARKPQ